MSEDGYITCECGYEIFLPKERAGRTIECLLCGAMIDTSQNIPGPRSVAEFDTSPPKPDRIDTPSETASPFEDDDAEERPSVSYSPIPQAAAEAPDEPQYNPSAFEDDDEEELDTNAPPAPDSSLIRSYEDPEHSNAYQDVQNAEACPKCGNPYRGDWDKQNINGEVMCYICSSQATESIPERILNKGAVAPDPVTAQKDWTGSVNAEIPTGPIEETFWLWDPESDRFKNMVRWLAIGLLSITILAIFTTDYSPVPQAPSSPGLVDEAQAEELPTLPRWATLSFWIIVGVMGFLGQFLSIYAVLYMTNRLPNGDFIGDVISIGYAMFWFTLVSIAFFAVAGVVSPMMMGSILMMLVAVVFGFILIVVAINMLDFRIRDFFYLAIVTGPVYGFISYPAAFIYAALAKIAL